MAAKGLPRCVLLLLRLRIVPPAAHQVPHARPVLLLHPGIPVLLVWPAARHRDPPLAAVLPQQIVQPRRIVVRMHLKHPERNPLADAVETFLAAPSRPPPAMSTSNSVCRYAPGSFSGTRWRHNGRTGGRRLQLPYPVLRQRSPCSRKTAASLRPHGAFISAPYSFRRHRRFPARSTACGCASLLIRTFRFSLVRFRASLFSSRVFRLLPALRYSSRSASRHCPPECLSILPLHSAPLREPVWLPFFGHILTWRDSYRFGWIVEGAIRNLVLILLLMIFLPTDEGCARLPRCPRPGSFPAPPPRALALGPLPSARECFSGLARALPPPLR